MPIRADNRCPLADFADNEFQLLVWQPTDIDLDVKDIVRCALGDYLPRNDVQTLKSLDDLGDRAGVSVCDDS